MNCWAYYVVSSGRQRDTLEDQAIWAQTVASENGWKISRTFGDDRNGVASGKSGVRKLLERLLVELQATPPAQRPERILMIRLDRVGRMALDSIAALAQIRRLGCVIHTRDSGDVSLETGLDAIKPILQLVTAEFENNARRDKTRSFQAKKRANGEFAGLPPFGFVIGADKKLAPYEPEAALVRELYKRRAAGWGWQRLAMFAAERCRIKLGANGKEHPRNWGHNSVADIVANERYRGAIVDAELWDAAQLTRDAGPDRRAPRWPWPLRGAVKCTCGAQLLGEASGREGARTRYYVCRRFNIHKNPRFPHHNADRLEAQFVALLHDLQVRPEAIFEWTNRKRVSSQELDDLRSQRTRLAGALTRIETRKQAAWSLAEDGGMAPTALRERLAHLEAEEGALTTQIGALDGRIADAMADGKVNADAEGLLRQAAALWTTAAIQDQRELAKLIGERFGGFWTRPEEPAVLLGYADVFDDAPRGRDDTLRNVDMAQRKSDDQITKKFIQSITE